MNNKICLIFLMSYYFFLYEICPKLSTYDKKIFIGLSSVIPNWHILMTKTSDIVVVIKAKPGTVKLQFLVKWLLVESMLPRFFYYQYQCFPTFFGSKHPYLVIKIFGGNPSWFSRFKDQGIVTIEGTPCTSSRHPSGIQN